MNTIATMVLDTTSQDAHRYAPRRQQRHLPAAPQGAPAPIWLPWRCRNWPVTPAEEHRFVVELAQHADHVIAETCTRSDITAVLNALRGGLTADELVDKVPGLPPSRLLAAYRDLESRRSAAAAAWHALVADGTPAGLRRLGGDAAVLVPVLVDRLAATITHGEATYRTTLERLAAYVEETNRNVGEIETALALWPDRAVELGARLYNPFGDAITNRVDHLARRVGLLTPNRVAALLGEAPTGGCPPGR